MTAQLPVKQDRTAVAHAGLAGEQMFVTVTVAN